MRRIFIDMDGVTALFEPSSIEEMTTEGFFINRKPVKPVITMVKNLMNQSDVEVYSLSSYLLPISKKEKIEWNSIHVGIPEDRQLYVPYGKDKGEFLHCIGGIRQDDMLLDDFSKNLHSWSGIGVKIYNGINGTHGSWKGFSIHSNMDPEFMTLQLNAISYVASRKAKSEIQIEESSVVYSEPRDYRR